MAELKTKPTEQSVEAFLSAIPDEGKRRDALVIVEMMKQATGAEPRMWGESMVGFGSYRYRYASGRQGDWPLTAFAPRKQNLTVYIIPGFAQYEQYQELLKGLGKHKTGKGCLYIKRLADINVPLLQELISQSVQHMRETYPQ